MVVTAHDEIIRPHGVITILSYKTPRRAFRQACCRTKRQSHNGLTTDDDRSGESCKESHVPLHILARTSLGFRARKETWMSQLAFNTGICWILAPGKLAFQRSKLIGHSARTCQYLAESYLCHAALSRSSVSPKLGCRIFASTVASYCERMGNSFSPPTPHSSRELVHFHMHVHLF